MVTLEQWRVLQAVVDHGGFAQAAERLHRSQSSISYSVARLQEQIGIPLLAIEGRKARLTEAGEAMLRRSRHLLREAQDLEEFARSLDAGWEPEVRLVVDAAFPNHLLVEALRRFEPVCRGTRVQLSEVVLSGAEDALSEGDADLVIGGRAPSGFLADPLIEIEFVAVAHTGHPLSRLGRPLGVPDLERERQIVVRDSGIHQPRDVGWLDAAQRWSVSGMESAVTLVAAGLGFAWLPRHRIAGMLADGPLAVLPLREGGSYRATLYLIHTARGAPGPGARQLAELLRQVALAGHRVERNHDPKR